MVHHLAILIINQAVIGKIFNGLQLAIFPDHGSFAGKNIMFILIVQLPLDLHDPFRRTLPTHDFLFKKFFVVHFGFEPEQHKI